MHLKKKNTPGPQKSPMCLSLMLSFPTPRGHWYPEFCVRCFLGHLYSFVTLSVKVSSGSRASVSDVG